MEEVTIAEALRDAGYATFFAGKWHLGTGAFAPNAQGFDPDLLARKGSFLPPGAAPSDPGGDPKETDLIANGAVRFIESTHDQPFFAYLAFHAVHIPIGARSDLVEKYKRKQSSALPNAWGKERGLEVNLVQNNPVYAAMVEQLDQAIGRVLAAIDRCGLADHTVIVFTSDNGGLATAQGHPTSNAPLRAGKGWLYEGGIRVPWLICSPGVTKPGSVCGTPVISNDFYPTLLDLAGLSLRPELHRDGVSLLPLLQNGTLQRGPLYWHYPHYGGQGGVPGGVIRDGDWKLIEWFEDGSRELFNLHRDLGEHDNLAAANPERVTELAAKLASWRKSVNGLMPRPNPAYSPQVPPGAKQNAKKVAK